MSKNLQQLQIEFLNYLQEQSSDILQEIQFAEQPRLDIYKEAYFTRLIDALACDYPCLQKQLGENLFQQLAKQYIVQNPSTYASLHQFGESFPVFLANSTYQDKCSLSELALFELALGKAFHAKDHDVIIKSALQQIPIEKWYHLRFDFHASLQILSLHWNTIPLWKGLHRQKPPAIKKYHQPQPWLIWRKQLENYFVRLSMCDAWALQAANKQMCFGDICQGLQQWLPQAQVILYATQLLISWIDKELIINIH